uniref:Neurolysin, mitochondrial n=1 Tax=Lygus hesperus TaxID=30085 RepID=A0A0A9X2D8_LYGHE
MATLLGYRNYADYAVEVNIVKKSDAVHTFLSDLNKGLDPLYEKDRVSLEALKREECKTLGIECEDMIFSYDRRYYTRMYNDKYYSIDDEQLRKYFPFDQVIEGMFTLYQTIFSVKFEQIFELEHHQDVSKQLWSPDVRLFKVYDNVVGQQNKLLGYFYMDMFPRAGKYSHAAAYPLIPGATNNPVTGPDTSDKGILPVVAIVCNFPKATVTEVSTLTHYDVVTVLHEFGHC